VIPLLFPESRSLRGNANHAVSPVAIVLLCPVYSFAPAWQSVVVPCIYSSQPPSRGIYDFSGEPFQFGTGEKRDSG